MKRKKIESISYKTIILSAVMIFLGLLLGGFVEYTYLLGSIGSFILLIGIILYIASQMGD